MNEWCVQTFKWYIDIDQRISKFHSLNLISFQVKKFKGFVCVRMCVCVRACVGVFLCVHVHVWNCMFVCFFTLVV